MNTADCLQNLREKNLTCLLLGAAGAGMSALADILRDLNHHVIGADSGWDRPAVTTPDIIPWTVDALPLERIDVCVHTPAITANHPMLMATMEAGIPVLSLHECLAEVLTDKQQICVAGTHGKTTTSAMLTGILETTGHQPSFFVGGQLRKSGRCGAFRPSSPAVIESCEFSNAFGVLKPALTVLTGIERDHFDRFSCEEDEDLAFRNLIRSMPPTGTLVTNADCPRSQRLSTDTIPSVSFGSADAADVRVREVRVDQGRTIVRVTTSMQELKIRLQVPGQHNAMNAAAALAAAMGLGISPEDSAAALENFSGVRRRFEVRGVLNGITYIDDYGHHPTAIRETLAAARTLYPGRRIFLVFEPHQVCRTESLFDDFAAELAVADEILLLPVFPAREQATFLTCCQTSGQLVRKINEGDRHAFLFANLDQIVSRIDHSARPSDICITMGAGRTHLIYDQLTRRLQRHSVA